MGKKGKPLSFRIRTLVLEELGLPPTSKVEFSHIKIINAKLDELLERQESGVWYY